MGQLSEGSKLKYDLQGRVWKGAQWVSAESERERERERERWGEPLRSETMAYV